MNHQKPIPRPHTTITLIHISHIKTYLFFCGGRGLALRGGGGGARNRLASSRLGLDACALDRLADLLLLQSLLLQLEL